MMHYYGYGIGWRWLEMMIIPLLLIGFIAYIIIKFYQNNESNRKDKNTDALAILNERFAKGEISEEEYQRKKKMLRD